MDIFNHPYQRLGNAPDLLAYARACSHMPNMALLESRKGAPGSRYDIIAAMPRTIVKLEDYDGDLTSWMDAIESALAPPESCASLGRIAIGFLDYDSAARQILSPSTPPLTLGKNVAACGIYDWCLIRDRVDDSVTLYCSPQMPDDDKQAIAAQISIIPPATLAYTLGSAFQHHTPREHYMADIGTIQRYIEAGDCYQVNYAQRFSAPFIGEPYAAYEALRDIAPGDFSAFLALRQNQAVLSLSPERFLSVTNGYVVTQPIKGTRPRHTDPVMDKAVAAELCESKKDRAENVMITDLLRNDLGRLCTPGSVCTTELCQLYSYENVHHLVSKVEGQLQSGVSAGRLLIGCSPGGSITGAPKRRAIEIINELEPYARGVYCGSVFAMDGSGWLESSIAIRTLEVVDGQISCWGGGGITFDSNAESEYQETLDKVGTFLETLENASHERTV